MKRFVESLTAAFPLQDSIEHLNRLVTWDRFQASDGIVQAAEFIAGVLEQYGLSDVRLHRYACPSRWWTFDGPVSWTPRYAALCTDDLLVEYPRDAMCVAANSAPIRAVSAPLQSAGGSDPAGAVILLEKSNLNEAMATAERSGALGIIADAADPQLPEARGRIELPNSTRLFGFSVTASEFARLRQATRVNVELVIDGAAPMPLVEGCVPGIDTTSEILVQAHLCHPRPGANDNCSGVASALGLASALASFRRSFRRSIRFLFGPEFVGTVAYLHDFVDTGRRHRPIAAINLDMVGENQAVCGGPLTIELPPDHLPSPLGAIAEHILTLLPVDARTYSGALPARTWNAVTTPFVGASDQGVHADRSVAIPAIMIGHWPDRFNHTSLDTPDKVDPEEIRRASLIAGACAWTMAAADHDSHEELASIVVHHTIARLLAAAHSRIDVCLMDHLANCGVQQVKALEKITGKIDDRATEMIDQQKRLLCTLRGPAPCMPPEAPGRVLERLWPGPFNVRGFLQQANGPEANRVRLRLAADKRTYAAVMALAHAIDNDSSRTGVMRRAVYSSMLDIDAAFAHDVFDAMLTASWVRER